MELEDDLSWATMVLKYAKHQHGFFIVYQSPASYFSSDDLCGQHAVLFVVVLLT